MQKNTNFLELKWKQHENTGIFVLLFGCEEECHVIYEQLRFCHWISIKVFFSLSTSSNLIFNSFCEQKMPTSFAYLISVGSFYFLLSYFYPHLITLIFIRFISVIIVPFILWVIKDLCTLLAALYYLFVVAATLCTLFMHLHIELIKSLDICIAQKHHKCQRQPTWYTQALFYSVLYNFFCLILFYLFFNWLCVVCTLPIWNRTNTFEV